MSDIKETNEKIKEALGDPKAPWYGSDLVPWVADLLEEYEKLRPLAEEPEAGEPKVIFLTRGQFTIVDAEDYEKLKKYKWYADYKDGWYARRTTSWADGHKTILMHREIMNPPDDMQIDHRSHNSLDNRRCNLRTCTQSDNQHNQRPRKNTSSKYKGVSWRKDCSKWHACIRHNSQLINLGDFNTAKEAAEAYNAKAKELFGEFACLNQIPKIK